MVNTMQKGSSCIEGIEVGCDTAIVMPRRGDSQIRNMT